MALGVTIIYPLYCALWIGYTIQNAAAVERRIIVHTSLGTIPNRLWCYYKLSYEDISAVA